MKQFTCDKCGSIFSQPLDEEKWKDEHGVWYIFDLCAPCRSKLVAERQKPNKAFFEKIKKEK